MTFDDDLADNALEGLTPQQTVTDNDEFALGTARVGLPFKPVSLPTYPARPALGPCALCRYWIVPLTAQADPWGECRVSAPHDWKPTKATEGCGVYERIPAPRAD